mmetsp:Transcript_33865/g.65454  ORF Transcript_33865/g.65454 Transcript_33865/m.65454 type:complete len:117 (-) Transcript_33865:899-1249(-)
MINDCALCRYLYVHVHDDEAKSKCISRYNSRRCTCTDHIHIITPTMDQNVPSLARVQRIHHSAKVNGNMMKLNGNGRPKSLLICQMTPTTAALYPTNSSKNESSWLYSFPFCLARY